MQCLIYLHNNNCPAALAFFACGTAASEGHLQCLQYLHEEVGCPWDSKVCDAAARGGHLDCLRYLHENGCSWGSHTANWAALKAT